MITTAPDVVVAMSGGVDSSVAAVLLHKQGYRIAGLFMHNWHEDDPQYCTAVEDFTDAAAVCQQLNIPLHSIDFSAEYNERVFHYFLAEYRAGRTPNPDVYCNRDIKFTCLLQQAKKLGANKIATGHYARIAQRDNKTILLKGCDSNKDQSYFLHQVPVEALAKSVFPLGEMHKNTVRELANQEGLPNHAKKDSTGICFIGKRPFKVFLQNYLAPKKGDVVDEQGKVLGTHDGVIYYTIGQRKGIGIGGSEGRPELPWYVAAKDIARNRLIVVQGKNHPAIFRNAATVTQLSWFHPVPQTLKCGAKTRYRQRDQQCTLSIDGQNGKVHFSQPQRAITPGQFIVFYAHDICLGGGIISAE